jgi:murein DD-endopeptidase MepM/ murein hydrolase activator NlpD
MFAVTAVVLDAPDASVPAAPAAMGTAAFAVPQGALAAHLRGDLPGSRVIAAPAAPAVASPPIAPVAEQLLAVERAIQADTVALAGFARALLSGGDARPTATSVADAYARADTAYRADLEAERTVYANAAHDPGIAATLAAWAGTASTDTATRVARNIDAVTASVRETEQRATDASTLAALGAIAPAQQAAIESGSPFIIPLTGVITQLFGPSTLGIEPTVAFAGVVYAHFHTGLDIAAPMDAPVRAAADGVVVFAGPQTDAGGTLVGYGNHVVIAHPQGFTTTYGHLDSITVTAGQLIAQGEVVGLEGSTGNSTGPHLHFEIRHDGMPLDPATYLQGQLP